MDICISEVVDGAVLPRWTRNCIGFDEWEELFVTTLGVGASEPWNEGDEILEFENRRRESFRQELASRGFPMLGRINDIYSDALYSPDEVAELLDELNRLEPITVGEMAKGLITKLKTAAEEALSQGGEIALIAD